MKHDDYYEYMFYKIKECDPRARVQAFADFLYQCRTEKPDKAVTYPKGSYISHKEEYETGLDDEIFEDIDALIYRNLSEAEFYQELDKYVFGICNEDERLSFWRYYSCLTNTCIPYYQIDFANTTVLSPEEYEKACENIDKDILQRMMGAIVADKTQNNSLLTGYAIVYLLDQLDDYSEQITALYYVLDAYYFMVTHLEETKEYFLESDKRLDIIELMTGNNYITYDPEDKHENVYIDEDFYKHSKEYLKHFTEKNGYDCYYRACRITQYINSGNYTSIIQIASVLMIYISKYDKLTDRAILLGAALRFFVNKMDWNSGRILYAKSDTEGIYDFYCKDYSKESYPVMTENELCSILNHATRDHGFIEYMFFRFTGCRSDVRRSLFKIFLRDYSGIKSDESVNYPVGRLFLRVTRYHDEYCEKFNEDIRQLIHISPTVDDFTDNLYSYVFESDDEGSIHFWKFYTCMNLRGDG